MKVVILAGGKGTRIASVANEIPKAMIPINGKPVLEYQVELAKKYGHNDIVLIIGHLGSVIQEYFKDGSKWGVNINYYVENKPLGTAGALADIRTILTEDFFVFYGDTVMDISLDLMEEFHKKHSAEATLLLHPNDHPYDSDLVGLNPESKVKCFYSKPHPKDFQAKNLVNAALYILSPSILSQIKEGISSDFGKDVFPKCLESGLNVFGYVSPEYIKDMGTPERYDQVCQDVISGKVQRLNRKNKRIAIFLDRDGVINREIDLLCKSEQFELIEGVAEAIRLINQKGYLVIIVTNQPVIARNLCDFSDLDDIHNKMETLLGYQHAYIDAIYFCPHHPDGGYPEERKEYKMQCNCRKPNPGMLLQAASEWNIDLSSSYMIGDRPTDIDAGIAAGVKESIKIAQNMPNALLDTIKKIL